MAFTWLSPPNWLRARRHVFAHVYDTTDAKRSQWVGLQARDDHARDFRLQRQLPDEFAFMILGGTGEGDAPQIVVVDKFLHERRTRPSPSLQAM